MNESNPQDRPGQILFLIGRLPIVCAVLLITRSSGLATTVLTNSDAAALSAAAKSGGEIRLAFDGSVKLLESILVKTNTALDATGHNVSIDGQNAVRLFVVTDGATLTLVNLKLVNGRSEGAVGQTNRTGEAGFGGAIYSDGGRIELNGCSFLNNAVVGGTGGPTTALVGGPSPGTPGGPAFGGGVYSANGEVFAMQCLFSSNSAIGGEGTIGADAIGYNGLGGDAFGGAIYATNSLLTITGVTFSGNLSKGGPMSGGRVTGGGGGVGSGGAFADAFGTSIVTRCTFATNTAVGAAPLGSGNGGAVYHGSGTLQIRQTLLSQNAAVGAIEPAYISGFVSYGDGFGGGVFNGAGVLEIEASALVGNHADGGTEGTWLSDPPSADAGDARGGGIFSTGLVRVINCTLANNTANGGGWTPGGGFASGGSAYGGGAHLYGGTASLVSVTLAGNSVQPGANSGHSSRVPAALGASILASNLVCSLTNSILFTTPGQTNVSGSIADGGHNICSDASAQFSSSTSHNQLNPMLGPLADNGGPTPTFALLPGSPAIDAGDDSVAPAVDQRGVRRPYGFASDIGAFELAPRLTLTYDPQTGASLEYSFLPNTTNTVFASTNLVEWLSLGVVPSGTNGVFHFQDPSAAQSSLKYYKVQPQFR